MKRDAPIRARSISLRAAASLYPNVTGRVLASFRSVCDLVTEHGDVVALVWGPHGNGPLNVLLDQELDAAMPAGAQFAMADHVLTVGDVEVDLSRATRWDARPDWVVLCARQHEIVAAAQAARRLNAGLKEQSLLKQAGPAVSHTAAQVQRAAQLGDDSALRAAITALCGLGPGLTPAGDDWLAGWLLGRRLTSDLSDPTGLANLSSLVTEVAATRTTTLSRAFLAAAAAGEADAAWHELLDALAGKAANQHINETTRQRNNKAAASILRHGATSGAAMLAGFFTTIETPAVPA